MPNEEQQSRIAPIDIEREMQDSFLEYAMSVIVSRALPDVRDGLKPVHRRILYAMYDAGIRPGTPFRKSARVVGDVVGWFHPHSPEAVYDAMVRLGQDFSMRNPLIQPQGNFGTVDDPPAAMRYTEARMAPIAAFLLEGIDEDTVDWNDNYSGEREEPAVLPARFPNLLVNGSTGIAVGMATNIPPHNLTEVDRRRPVRTRSPGGDRRRPLRVRARPRLPDRCLHRRHGRSEAGPRNRAGLRQDAGRHRHRGDEARPYGDHRHRDPVSGVARPDHGEDGRPGAQEDHQRYRRPPRRVGPRRNPSRGRAAEGCEPPGRAEPALQAHAARGELLGQPDRPRRRCSANAEHRRDDPLLHRPSARSHRAAEPLPAREGRSPLPHRRGAAHRPRQHRRSCRDHQVVRRRRRCPHGLDGEVRAQRDSSQPHPRHAAAAVDRSRNREAPRGVRRASEADRRAQGTPRRRRASGGP